MTRTGRRLCLLAALLALPAHADVRLEGSQHIGDSENSSFEPRDPVRRAQMQARPSRFHLSQATTITAVRLENPNDLDGQLQVFIDDMNTPLAGTLAGGTYTLAAPLTLPAGVHTIFPDGGCTPAGFALPCATSEKDIGFSAITLVSAQISASRNFSRRTHLGNTTDADDDYDGAWYPDVPDGADITLPFTLEVSRVLSEVRLYRLRDVAPMPSRLPRVQVDGTPVGTIAADADPAIVPAGLLLAPGPHTVTVHAGNATGITLDDISFDDLILLLTNDPATTPGLFNAVDPTGDAASGPITTKVAGAAFTLDIVAVRGGAQFTAYTGSVIVTLVDASDAARTCETWPAVAALGTVTFASTDNGRKALSASYAGALRDARLRMVEPALGITSCSVDNFAVRPAGFAAIQASHDDADASVPGVSEALADAGFTPSAIPVHRAGRPFALQASAVNALGAVTAGYDGSPTLAAVASLLGAHTGTASASGWSGAGTVRTASAGYDEVGAARLRLSDTSFAAVDADDTPAADRTIGPTAFDVGRFIPDRFTFTEVQPAEFAAGSTTFTYVGQPFFFTAPPSARITAVAMDGSPTRNYSDPGLYRIALHAAGNALPQSAYAAVAGTFDTSGMPDPDNGFINEGNGASLFTLIPRPGGYRFVRGAPELPFDADITITLALADQDGVAFAVANPGRFGDPAPDAGIPFRNGPSFNEVRYGRLVIENAYGSERLPLAVPLRVEYWDSVSGSAGFRTNLADNFTPLALGHLALAGSVAGPPDPPTDTVPTLSPLASGGWTLSLSAPNDPGQATITSAIAAPFPWLLTDDGDADTSYDDEAAAVATFGVFRRDQRRVFQREVVGP